MVTGCAAGDTSATIIVSRLNGKHKSLPPREANFIFCG